MTFYLVGWEIKKVIIENIIYNGEKFIVINQ